jgi:Cytochrome c554 and c-prime
LFILSLLLGALLGISVQSAPAQAQPTGSASACANCHHAQAAFQSQTPMGRAITLPGSDPTLAENPKLTLTQGQYTYSVETQSSKSTYSVTDGKTTISLPIRWIFGAGVQAWVLERDGQFYESLVSYYPETRRLDTTIGDESLKPHTLDQAVGRPLTQRDLRECFGCHATNAVQNGELNLASAEPGVTCQHCHAGASAHLVAAVQGNGLDSAPPNLSKLSAEDISSFCGTCHRSFATVIRNHWRGRVNVRFQPYRLALSRCFNGAASRISCLACHDPHQDVVRTDVWYDSKCLACHTTSAQHAAKAAARATDEAKSCPVAKSNCISCHMPKVKLPDEHVTFTDHFIRVVKPGEPYPD